MTWPHVLQCILPAAFGAFLLAPPHPLSAEGGGTDAYAVSPALEKALREPRHFSREDPAAAFERSRRRWRKAWFTSVAAFAAANVLDLHSSAGKMELNPLLRGDQGRFATGRAALLKGGIGAGFVALQGWMIRRNPEKNYYRSFTFANAAASASLGGLAARNYGVPKAGDR